MPKRSELSRGCQQGGSCSFTFVSVPTEKMCQLIHKVAVCIDELARQPHFLPYKATGSLAMIQSRARSPTHVRQTSIGTPEPTSSHKVESAWWRIITSLLRTLRKTPARCQKEAKAAEAVEQRGSLDNFTFISVPTDKLPRVIKSPSTLTSLPKRCRDGHLSGVKHRDTASVASHLLWNRRS